MLVFIYFIEYGKVEYMFYIQQNAENRLNELRLKQENERLQRQIKNQSQDENLESIKFQIKLSEANGEIDRLKIEFEKVW